MRKLSPYYICHVSCVTCQLSHVICQFFFFRVNFLAPNIYLSRLVVVHLWSLKKIDEYLILEALEHTNSAKNGKSQRSGHRPLGRYKKVKTETCVSLVHLVPCCFMVKFITKFVKNYKNYKIIQKKSFSLVISEFLFLQKFALFPKKVQKWFLSTFLVLLFVRVGCLYVPPHVTCSNASKMQKKNP